MNLDASNENNLDDVIKERDRVWQELQMIRQSRSWRLVQLLHKNAFVQTGLKLPRYFYILFQRFFSKKSSNASQTILFDSSKEQILVSLRLTAERNPNSRGNEVWILDLLDEKGNSLIEWESLNVKKPWKIIFQDQLSNKKALVSADPSTIRLRLPQGAWIKILNHQWSGVIEIEYGGVVRKFDLYSPVGSIMDYKVDRIIDGIKPSDTFSNSNNVTKFSSVEKFNEDEQNWISMIRDKRPDIISIQNPEWQGVSSSAKELFECLLFLKDDLDPIHAERIAVMIEKTECQKIVFNGFPLSYHYLVKAIHRRLPKIKVYAIWHGSFFQSEEDYNWLAFNLVYKLCKDRLIHKWGFVKKGIAEVVNQMGIPAGFVMNYVKHIPDGPSKPLSGGPHFGVWSATSIWRKNPYAMLAALSLIPNAKVFMVGGNHRAKEFGNLFKLEVNVNSTLIPELEMPVALAKMSVNLYVTLSECAPMLPLESLSVGVPCLIGPTSHFFEDHSYLHSRLVVPYPDRSDIIVKYINRALEERSEIINEYIRYAPEYNRNARETLYDFLEIPDNCNSIP